MGGIRALKPVANASNRMSRASLWQLTCRDGVEHLLGVHSAQRVGAVVGSVGPAAVLVVGGLAVLFAWSRLTDPTPELVAVGALAAFLPPAATCTRVRDVGAADRGVASPRRGEPRHSSVWSALLTVAYQAVRPMPTSVDDLAVWLVSMVTLVFAFVAIAMLAVAAVRRLRTPPVGEPLPARPIPIELAG